MLSLNQAVACVNMERREQAARPLRQPLQRPHVLHALHTCKPVYISTHLLTTRVSMMMYYERPCKVCADHAAMQDMLCSCSLQLSSKNIMAGSTARARWL
jgi:hypothetical protein